MTGSRWDIYIHSAVSLFFVISLVPVGNSLKSTHMSCVKVRECVCEFASGVGFDLTNQNVTTYVSADNQTFYFQPCNYLKLADCDGGTTLCVHKGNTNTSSSLAMGNEASFTSFGINGPVSLLYQHGTNETKIDLICDTTQSSLFPAATGIEGLDGKQFHFVLRSPEACLRQLITITDTDGTVNHGLSTGSLIVTLLLILVLAYLIFGSLANYFLRGARGWEVIPNHDFWLSLPRLCMDGVRFALNGCRPPPSYEQI